MTAGVRSMVGWEKQAGYRNKTWMSGTNMTSERERYRGVFVWNHDEATRKKLNGCCKGECVLVRLQGCVHWHVYDA